MADEISTTLTVTTTTKYVYELTTEQLERAIADWTKRQKLAPHDLDEMDVEIDVSSQGFIRGARVTVVDRESEVSGP